MACTRKRRGKWVIDYYDQFGKRHWETIGTNKKEAEERLAQRITEIQKGAFHSSRSKISLRQYSDRWLDDYAKVNLKASTLKSYKQNLSNHILPIMGHITVNFITRDMVKDVIAALVKKGLSRNSIRIAHATLRVILNSAIEDGLLAANPAQKVGRFTKSRAERQKDINPLTPVELSLFLNAVRTYFPAHYPFFLTLARTGMRLV